MGILRSNEVERDSTEKSAEKVSYDEQDEEEAIDENLVKEARTILKEDWKINGNYYSERHYRDIIDEGCPYTCWRYLVYREYSVTKAVELMKASLRWRKENRADECLNSEFPKELWYQTPLIMSGTSKTGNEDVLYVISKFYRKPKPILRPIIRSFVTNSLYQWDQRNASNLRTLMIVFDTTDTGFINTDLDFTRWLINIKDYMPARMSAIYVIGIPYILRPLVQLIISWLPQEFSQIVKCGTFEELVAKNIGPESLPLEVGGTAMKAYIAPIESPWIADSPSYLTDEMQKELKASLWFDVSQERWDQMRSQQIKFESDAQAKKQ